MTKTKFQPVLPVEEAPTDAELEFMELSPSGLFPENQDSNFGYLIRKLWTDKVQDTADQQTLMFNEKFPSTSTQFLDSHEKQYGLPVAPATLSIAQRRQQVLNRIRVGPFTRTRLRNLVQGYIGSTFGNAIQLTTDGVALDPGGVALYGEASPADTLFTIIEDIPNFHFTIAIKNTVTPDEPSLRRELDRIVPAHISYSIVYTTGLTIQFANVAARTTVSGRISRRFRVITAQVSATSTVTGMLQKNIVQSRVNAITTVSGRVAHKPRITGGAVSNTSTVSATLQKQSTAPAAHVQNAFVAPAAGTAQGTSYNATFANPVVVGNYIIVALFRWAMTASEGATVTDSLGNTYTRSPLGSVLDLTGGDNVAIDIFTAPITTGGACSVTASLATARAGAMIIKEVSGGGIDKISLATGVPSTATDNISGGTVTPTQNNELICGFVCNGHSGAAFNPGTGYTGRIAQSWPQAGNWIGSEDKSQTTAAAVAATWTEPTFGSQDYVAATVTVLPGGTTGGGGGGGSYSTRGAGSFRMGGTYDTAQINNYKLMDSFLVDLNATRAGADLPLVRTHFYRSALSVRPDFDTSIDWNTANTNGWLLRDSGGSLLYNTGYPVNNILDLTQTAVATALANNAISYCSTYGFKGVWFDDVVRYATTLLNALPAGMTQAQWYTNIVAHTRRIAKQVKAAGYECFFNAAGFVPGDSNSDTGTNTYNFWSDLCADPAGSGSSAEDKPTGLTCEYWEQYTDPSSGATLIRTGGNIWYQNWDGWRTLHQLCNTKGVLFEPFSYGAADSTTAIWAKATFLLDWNGGSSDVVSGDGSANPYGSTWAKAMGAASGAASFNAGTGVWTRVFANGTVTINPVAGTASIT